MRKEYNNRDVSPLVNAPFFLIPPNLKIKMCLPAKWVLVADGVQLEGWYSTEDQATASATRMIKGYELHRVRQ